jgi:hypothetical protein
MSFIIRIATLYEKSGDPKASSTPWVQVILRCDNLVDRTYCVVEQHSGTTKLPTNPEVAETVSDADAERQFNEIVQGWERKGFKLHVDHRPYPTRRS